MRVVICSYNYHRKLLIGHVFVNECVCVCVCMCVCVCVSVVSASYILTASVFCPCRRGKRTAKPQRLPHLRWFCYKGSCLFTRYRSRKTQFVSFVQLPVLCKKHTVRITRYKKVCGCVCGWLCVCLCVCGSVCGWSTNNRLSQPWISWLWVH